jgi:hypothetical protein
METLITTETLFDLQNKITVALQTKVLAAINQNQQYRRELQAVELSVDLLSRLKYITRELDEDDRVRTIGKCY